MAKIFKYNDLTFSAKEWALSQVLDNNPSIPPQEVEEEAEKFEYNKAGDIMEEKPLMTPRTEKNRQFRDHFYSENF